ncbi:hypothetical protein CFN79_08125 [Chromobacterium vaccinii]|uniref:hypothetical protein n=1 Tax=Chromobacterium vaccinii TaxID=1108595 RepID=UPI000CE98C8B|nr:hypothetical protein [Chromobacterium vaccinii]AVG15827.1 hypothetical protein CFN79_08125 [Chromobacterium vaccinii]
MLESSALKTPVLSRQRLDAATERVTLGLPSRHPDVRPGQAIQVQLADGRPFFSIAGLQPGASLELHVTRRRDSRSNPQLFAALDAGSLQISLPHGAIALTDDRRLPDILIASQSGYAQSRAMLDWMARRRPGHRCRLLWQASSGYLEVERPWLEKLAAAWAGLSLTLLPLDEHDALNEALAALPSPSTQGLAVVSGSSHFLDAARHALRRHRYTLLSDQNPAALPSIEQENALCR